MAGFRIDVDVDGTTEIAGKLTKFQASSRRLKPAFEQITDRALIMGRFHAPRYGGRTRSSLKGKASNLQSHVKAGNGSYNSHGGGIYVRMNHFGTRWDGQTPNPWLYRTLAKTTTFAVQRVRRELMKRKEEAGL
ncbi:hypothetical protein [Rhodococcus sp. B10]|uniref:hypothetical protein n=1 Tax=Rhodococcus sp. B10 TaxID=2695876 RepID=UPI00142FE3E4|nr:hypothetical protein [Rhodococcus sp. B10]NIL76793.1 hypothetical protein [Rhodococcus sp. B10]